MTRNPADPLDLLVVGAGPTGIAIGADAVRAGLDVVLVDRGSVTASIAGYPTHMEFFTTRDRLEIADVAFTIPDVKPTRRQALAYYRAVVAHHDIPLALFEEVRAVYREADLFRVETRRLAGPRAGQERSWTAHAVALATGYFGNPRRLGVPGEELSWVSYRYLEPFAHFGERVVVVGGGNSAAEAALDLWRNGARVTLVHRRGEIKPSVKYWLKPDIENRIEEGSVEARFDSVVTGFGADGVTIEQRGERHVLPADAAYVLIGYRPDVEFAARCGVEVDPESLIPTYDPETLESNVPGLYVAGTLQAGRRTDTIFIENTRDHGEKIVAHLLARRGQGVGV